MDAAGGYRRHDVPEEFLEKWQETIDVLAGIFDVPAGLIMRVWPKEIEVLIRSRRKGNPYEPNEKARLNTGLYCETVMSTRSALHVPHALEDPAWKDNPDVALDMISYIGVPLVWPDNSVFGTVCVLDSKRLPSSEQHMRLIEQFRGTIERDFQLITHTFELEEIAHEKEKARLAAEQANRAKSAFLANTSHELRTPLNAILGYSEMLIEEVQDSDQATLLPDLNRINEAGTHLLGLINDVLDLSKIESGKMDIYPERFDVAQLVGQAAKTTQPLIDKNSNRLVVELGEDLGEVLQDATKIRQSLLNLLSNAAKFTKAGTVTLNARRETVANDDWLVVSVVDTGIGIAQDKLDDVFEEFSQAEHTTTRDFGGTGLGLPISRRLCRLLGGDLVASSCVGRGSTFTIRVPCDLKFQENPA